MGISRTSRFVLLGVVVLLMGAAAGPLTVFAEGESLASPTPYPPERITAPEIFGVNPEVVLSEGNQGESHPSDIFFKPDQQTRFPIEPPGMVDLIPLKTQPANLYENNLAVPMRMQDEGEVTCGLAAIGMAMDFIEIGSGEKAPSHQQLLSYFKGKDLLYEWGTGVEELAYAARSFGYGGSTVFSNWTIEQLRQSLKEKKPVVVSLGVNGKDQPGHFVLVTGISKDGKWIYCNDPLKGKITVGREEFLRDWSFQDESGVLVQKKQLLLTDDPFIHWMGIFNALSMIALIANRSKGIDETHIRLRRKLSNPKRIGIGGGPLPPEHPDIETVKEQKYQYTTVYRGIKTIKVDVPVYQTQKIQVGLRGVKKKVPQYEVKQVQVGVDSISRRVPVYERKEIIVGTREVKKTIPVTRYRENEVMEWKKTVKRVPVFRKVGKRRYLVGTRNQISWKKVPTTKRIPYRSTKTITLQKPVYKDIKVLKGYRTEIENIPKYQNKKVLVGYKTVRETEPIYEERKIKVGTKTITRQMPDYQTVKVLATNNVDPDSSAKNSVGSITKNSEIKLLDKNDNADQKIIREFEVTDVVYLRGGPGSNSYGIKAEEGYSKHSYGGESLPIMRGIGLSNIILVWIRDNTRIIERMGGKPDARGLIFFTKQGSKKLIDEIRVKNLGNEVISIIRVNISIEKSENGRMKMEETEIFPVKNMCISFDEVIKILPENMSLPIHFSPIELNSNQNGELWIWIESESGRSGPNKHLIQNTIYD